ncbi:MAG TPA: efflux RND transporter permease subunit [Cellvibrio sp.]|nr:efflux RND transporter permease subunit [Cellvibrio sp.]
MMLSDISIRRPVFASVLSLLLIAFGIIAFDRLSLREYPNIDPPIVSIRTSYPGAAATIVETRITKPIEDRISGVEGIRYIESSSENGVSNVTVIFNIDDDIEAAANDIRDKVSSVLGNLPEEASTPEVQKVSADDDVIIWMSLAGENMSVPELSDYATRYIVDKFSAVEGVARVRIGGEQRYAMRVWLDRKSLAAHSLTVEDIENALRAENIELPAGSVESQERQYTVRMARTYRTQEQFAQLVVKKGKDGHLIRLGDIAKVERGTVDDRSLFRGNGAAQVGIGIIKQSTANTLDVARGVELEKQKFNSSLPKGMMIEDSYNSAVFIDRAIHEVYITLVLAIFLVILVIYIFLGSVRAMIVPAVAVPVSIIATFTVLAALNFSVNMLTLLALVLAIGLVVDDAIVVLENIVRHIEEKGKPVLLAAYDGVREVGFAVIATTLVLISIFIPIVFLQGDVGRLFSEFAITMAASVAFSALVALTLSPMLASKILRKETGRNAFVASVDKKMHRLRDSYKNTIIKSLHHKSLTISVFMVMLLGCFALMYVIPSEYAPREDRGNFQIIVNGPEGASYSYMEGYMAEIEKRLLPYVDAGEISRLMVRAPRSFGSFENFNGGMAIVALSDWGQRRNGFVIMDEIRAKLSDLPGVTASPVMRQGFGSSSSKPVQFVIGGGTYEELAKWRDILLQKINEKNPGLSNIDWDYKETKPQIEVKVDINRAADLGVSVSNIGHTLETLLGSRKVTTYIEQGEEYDVLVQGERDEQRTKNSLENMYVRSSHGDQLIPLASVIKLEEVADASKLNRYNRMRSLTLEAGLTGDLTLGESLDYLNQLVKENLPANAIVDYRGMSRDFKNSTGSMFFMFALGILITYLVLAAQFESYIHPLVIMLTVPLAIAGGLFGLWITGSTLNLYSQIGLIMLIGLAAKNGILIVEFTNQLRDRGVEFSEALLEAASARLRPIIMTSLTAVAGALPLVISSGAGSETRFVIGVVVISGVIVATFFTLFVVPVAYSLLAKNTGSPEATGKKLEQEIAQFNALDD